MTETSLGTVDHYACGVEWLWTTLISVAVLLFAAQGLFFAVSAVLLRKSGEGSISLVRFMFVRGAVSVGWAIVFVAMLFGKNVGLQVLAPLFIGSVVLMEWFARRFRAESATNGDASQGSTGT